MPRPTTSPSHDRSPTGRERRAGTSPRRAAFALTAAALAIAAAPAHAGYFVATFAQSYINAEGSAIEWGYNIDQFQRLAIGGSQFGGGCGLANCSASGSGTIDAIGAARSSVDQTRMDSTNLSHDGTQVFATNATALARADLATGTIGVQAAGTHLDVNGTGGQDGGTGTANAILNDTLHFSIAGANASTVTFINVVFTVDGLLGWAGQGVEASALIDPRFGFGTASFTADISANGAQAPAVSRVGANGWQSYTVSPLTPGKITFSGVYELDGATADLGVQENLFALCGGGDSCDYSHTAHVAFSLPSDVSFTSDSGVFLSAATIAPVPEPESYAMLLAGLGAVGAVVRRRRI